jgi:fructose/tagatose bisphosphate aldolase
MPLKTPFCLVIRFITLLQVVTSITFYNVTCLHSLQSLHTDIPVYLFGASGIHLENFETAASCSVSQVKAKVKVKVKVTLQLTVSQ